MQLLPRPTCIAPPISANEFYEALKHAWSIHPRRSGLLGLAISGGVDSMALATLCAERASKTFDDDIVPCRFHAFIVDHGARKRSGREAEMVAEQLKQMNIESSILTLQWPSTSISPSHLPHFERRARTLRYDALARACLTHNIDAILLAHHRDDQAEGLLLRLIHGYTGSGLRGLRESARLPASWGLFGVNPAGVAQNDAHTPNYRLRIDSSPGIRLLRPFLGFNKSRLLATCLHHHTPWWQDPTNYDARLTARNAIRHVQASLPRALQSNSLAEMASRLQRRSERRARCAEMLWQRHVRFVDLDLRVGIVVVELPSAKTVMESIESEGTDEHRFVAAHLLRRILLLVSPNPLAIQLRELHAAASVLFPSLFSADSQLQTRARSNVNIVTIGKVQIRRIVMDDDATRTVYELSRQPFYKTENAGLRHVIPPLSANSCSYMPPFLWDGRYWLRVHNPTDKTLCVRPFSKSDYCALKASKTGASSVLQELFPKHECGYSRPRSVLWSIPALVEAGADEEKLISLVTISKELPTEAKTSINQGIKWECMFRAVDVDM